MLFNSTDSALAARHIQSSEGVEYTIDYWGYAVRNFPCRNDIGSCEYLDSVYSDHYTSMTYTFIMWAVLGAILLVSILMRLACSTRKPKGDTTQSFYYRSVRFASSTVTRHLVPECTKVFRYTTRLQALLLVLLCVYLAIFS
jgi:ferric-chelate reductase